MFKIQRKKKIIIFELHPEGVRGNRFKEEINKRGIEFKIIDPNYTIITNDGIFYEGEKLQFDKNTVVFFGGNSLVSHFLSKKITTCSKFSAKMIWPSGLALLLDDKFCSNAFFTANKIMTPKTVLINHPAEKNIEEMVKIVGGYPVVFKKSKSSTGKYVEIAKSTKEVLYFIEKFFGKQMIMPFRESSYILQEFIKESAGTDFRVLVLDGKILGGIKRSSADGDFRANVSLGGKAEIIEVDDDLKKMSLKIAKKGDLFYAGIDFIKRGDEYLAIEVNTSAQFEGFESATGINVAGKIIEALLRK